MVFCLHLCINYAVFLCGQETTFKHFLKQLHRHKIGDLILIHAKHPSCSGTRYNKRVSSIFACVPDNQRIPFRKQDSVSE